jgi:Ala-tRNA(Pro) deacylase
MKDYFLKIVEMLNGVDYLVVEHAPTPTSLDSARERGESLHIGAKALVIKAAEFMLVVLPANRKVDSTKLKTILHSKKLRFATQEELKDLTGLSPGAVPPFGSLFNLPMLVERHLFDEEWMAFNAGSLTKSIKMKTVDYRKWVNPKTAEFSSDAPVE